MNEDLLPGYTPNWKYQFLWRPANSTWRPPAFGDEDQIDDPIILPHTHGERYDVTLIMLCQLSGTMHRYLSQIRRFVADFTKPLEATIASTTSSLSSTADLNDPVFFHFTSDYSFTFPSHPTGWTTYTLAHLLEICMHHPGSDGYIRDIWANDVNLMLALATGCSTINVNMISLTRTTSRAITFADLTSRMQTLLCLRLHWITEKHLEICTVFTW